MSKQERIDEIVDTVLEGAHAQVVNGVTYFFAEDGWHSGARELDELVVGIDRSTTRADRAEVRDLVGLLAPKGAFAPPRYIAFRNGVLDVETMALSDASPDLLVPNRIPWDWVPGASSDVVEAYLDATAAGDPAIRARIEEMLGACLHRKALAIIFLVLGAAPVPDGSAANGKSTLAKLCRLMVGDGNARSLDVHVFGARFMAAHLAGALVDVSPDTSPACPDKASLSVLKSVATGDRIASDVKNSDIIEFNPYATPVIVANRAPGFLVDSGLKSRPVVIPLKGKFPRRGPDPTDEIATDENMPALLAHAVEGLRRLLDQGPTPCPDGDAAYADVVALSSSIDLWASDRGIDPSDLNGKPCTAVYQLYETWCRSQGETPARRADFDLDVRDRWPGLRNERKRFNGEPTTNRWFYTPPAAPAAGGHN